MTQTRIFLSLFISVLFLIGISNSSYAQSTAKKPEITKVEYNVNLHCESCKEKVGKCLAYEKGVKTFNVDVDNKKVSVTYDPTKTTSDKISKAIANQGYTVTTKTAETHKCPSSPSACPNASPNCCKKAPAK